MMLFKKSMLLTFAFLAAGLLSLSACADAPEASATSDKVKAKLQSVMGFDINSIADAPIDGLYQLNTQRGIFYASKDGKYLVQARIYNVDAGMRDETEAALTGVRVAGLKRFEKDVIEFKAKDEKYVVNVFTDISCGYCRRLHEQMGEYNEKGITVRYLAFPRAGLQGKAFNDMVSVWCADDRQEAMTLAKAGDTIEATKCENSIGEQYRFGQQVGVNGTPNIVLPNGQVIPGYQPAAALLQALDAAS